MNATARRQDYLDAGSQRLRNWQDEHLSVEATRPARVEARQPSFPQAPRDLPKLNLRRGLGGALKL